MASGQHSTNKMHHSRNLTMSLNGYTRGRDRKFVERGDGAGDGIRTRDINLGKVALYQLSYSRDRSVRRTAEAVQRMFPYCLSTLPRLSISTCRDPVGY